MATELVLRDGTAAMIWPLSPSDARGLAENYERLSDRSRYLRFLSPIPRLSPDLLRRLVDGVNCVDHIALILVVFPSEGDEQAVGIARLIRLPDDPTAADVAVTVDDAWQGKGIATALLAELIAVRPEGVETIRTQVAADNSASLAMLRRLGETSVALAVPGVYDVRVELEPRAARP